MQADRFDQHEGPEVFYETPTLSSDTLWVKRSFSTNSPFGSPARSPPGIMRSSSVAYQPDSIGPSLPETPAGLCFSRVAPHSTLAPGPAPDVARDPRRRMGRLLPPLPPVRSGPPARELPPLPGVCDDRRRRRIGRQFDALGVISSQTHHTDVEDHDDPPPSSGSSDSSTFGMVSSRRNSDDSDSSSGHDSSSPLQFPQPPPLSPLLRRMQSSPTISKHASRDAARLKCANVKRSASLKIRPPLEPLVRISEIDSPTDQTNTIQGHVDTSLPTGEDFSWEATSPALSHGGKFGFQQWLEGGEDPFHNAGIQSMSSEPSSPQTAPSTPSMHLPSPPSAWGQHRARLNSQDSMIQLPQAIRKVASTRSPIRMEISQAAEEETRIRGNRSSALNRLEFSLEKLKAFNSSHSHLSTSDTPPASRARHHLRSCSTGSGLAGKFPPRPTDSNNAFLSSIERPSYQHRAHQSEAIPSMPGAFAGHNEHATPSQPPRSPRLAPGFTHRPTKSNAALSEFQYPKKLQKDRQRMTTQPACFMDVSITPEQDAKRDPSFRRVKKMISRASLSLQGWGRNLTSRKKSQTAIDTKD